MLLVKTLLVIAHVITAAAWFGLGLRLAARARLVVRLSGEDARAAADDTARDVRLIGVFVLLTLLFGAGAFLVGGGFGGYGPQYHTSLLLIVVAAGVHYALVRPGWMTPTGALAHGEDAEAGRKRVAMGIGIEHLLWLVIIVLMFWTELSVSV